MEQLINFIIRPPRAEYDPNNDLLEDEFTLRGKLYQRKDLEVKNTRGDVLQCSHYLPIVSPEGKPLPCVIYCHGNSGCRADASEAAIILLPSNITVFALDFSGSGLSGGEHVTLGWNEKDDLKAVVEYLRADGNVSLIGLWGRSMGAVTSLMYGAENPSIAGMVLDSPFSDLVELMMELVETYKFRLPKFTVKFAIQYMRRAIQKKAKFDIMDLNTIKVAKSCFVPVLIGHAIDDDFIRPHHSDQIHDAYVGDKNIIKFDGDHNSPRPQFYFDSINIFFHNVLQPPEDEIGDIYINTMPSYFSNRDYWRPMQEAGPNHGSSTTSRDIPTNSTEGAIKELRSKRSMSRTEVPADLPSGDHQSLSQDRSTSNDTDLSSSNMISFELSNGHPYETNVPNLMDDDQYVEYPLDDLAGFPCSVEEEERMLMEAVMESLKDFKMKNTQEEEQASSVVCTDTKDVLQKDECGISRIDHCGVLHPEATSTSNDHFSQLKAESASTSEEYSISSKPESTSVVRDSNSVSDRSCSDKSESSIGVPAPAGTESAGASSCSNTPASSQRSAEADLSANTKATVTVVRNPATHIMDGLIRRWDLNFFRNNQNR
ncbi:uncharacterized protein LOC111806722 [Cucurbita pepo subsp. pepo]|uniref:uncharacterized protein LOC111806722 n=1 Tax=Cucurbita pepo subsp. pepo TaxID=3664 RepID=UPI000C9D6D0E|nr:uncharacterized protein LOC111806722 [Cucurbita pepo subsp. pepo]XP_023547927.1 uncharacterized protein LOC111806722 [Cucurbita pepo subsp. pepo]